MPTATKSKVVWLDGESLTPEVLFDLGYNYKLEDGCQVKVSLTDAAWAAVKRGRKVVDDIMQSDSVVYGINTGFGLFSKVQISKSELEQLQLNLIRSHSVGVGDYLTHKQTRMLLALRINVLSKGHSGITVDTLQKYIDALNSDCISCVPSQGTVGASGDLAPLSHLALGYLGEGEIWDISSEPATPKPAAEMLAKHGLSPLNLKSKEGLALINGTQFICGIGSEALVRAERIARQADIISAITLEVLNGTVRGADARIHRARPHIGQNLVAARLRSLLKSDRHPSEIAESHRDCGVVQDAYTLRCVPQIHGITHDTLAFIRRILTTELNSATDNPMIFTKDDHRCEQGCFNCSFETPEALTDSGDAIISGGNFHGEYPAKILDMLAIVIHELSSVSERRIERLCNPDLSPSALTPFLVPDGGLNSGFMMAHVTAAALVSENKVLCHPSSVDSLSTSAAKEDHVSMGGFSARKALRVVVNVERVLAIELLCAMQALDLHRPLRSTTPIEAVYARVRQSVSFMQSDRYLKPDIDCVSRLLREEVVFKAIEPYVDADLYALTEVDIRRPVNYSNAQRSKL